MKTKGFSLRRVFARRDKIYARAMPPYYDAQLVGQTISDLCDDILPILPQAASRDALYESLRVLAGTQLNHRAAKVLAWRLAGNVDQLVAGRPVLPWTRQIADEIVPVRVQAVRPDTRNKQEGFSLECRALAGSPCAMVFTQFVSKRSCFAIARPMGFSGSFGLYRFSTPHHFVNLLFFAHIEAARSHEFPQFEQVSGNSSLRAENRQKIEVRCRAKPCPQGYLHPCLKCWVGYNECPAAIRPESLVARECPQCRKEEFFEPGSGSLICINCRAAQHHVEQG